MRLFNPNNLQFIGRWRGVMSYKKLHCDPGSSTLLSKHTKYCTSVVLCIELRTKYSSNISPKCYT